MSEPKVKIRLDKWLWHARFFKTRSLSAKVISAGHCRVNGQHVAKPAFGVSDGDVLTFRQGTQIRVIRVVALGTRRGPAPEAAQLYDDLEPPQPQPKVQHAPAYDKGGRPTKRDRRKLTESRSHPLE